MSSTYFNPQHPAQRPARSFLFTMSVAWGRFQDADESAHYEFLWKSASVPVHYRAETFPNDGSLSSLIMKAIKRTMAGEYSRELGVKVLARQKRLACLGFKQGGIPGYGLRRMLVSLERHPKQLPGKWIGWLTFHETENPKGERGNAGKTAEQIPDKNHEKHRHERCPMVY